MVSAEGSFQVWINDVPYTSERFQCSQFKTFETRGGEELLALIYSSQPVSDRLRITPNCQNRIFVRFSIPETLEESNTFCW